MDLFDPDLLANATIGDLFDKYTDSIVLWDDEEMTIIWHRDGNTIRQEIYGKNFAEIFEKNAKDANEFSKTGRLPDLMVRTASIPTILWKEWEASGLTKDDKALRRRLNDSDYSKLRVNSLRM